MGLSSLRNTDETEPILANDYRDTSRSVRQLVDVPNLGSVRAAMAESLKLSVVSRTSYLVTRG